MQEFRMRRRMLNDAGKRALVQSSQAGAAAGSARLEEMRAARRQRRESGAALRNAFEQFMQRDEGTRRILAEMRDHPLFSPLPGEFGIEPKDSVMSIELTRHTSLADPPLDGQWHWGNAYSHELYPEDGQMIINGASGHSAKGVPDAVSGACGLDLVITTDRPAIVDVRPLLKCEWRWLNGTVGLFSSAESRGGLESAIFEGPTLITPVRRTTLWSSRVYSGAFDGPEESSGEGAYAFAPWQDLAHRFTAQANLPYVLKIGVWVECDHSFGIGVSAGQGGLSATVHHVAIDRWVAG
jgi:hypothetical protein